MIQADRTLRTVTVIALAILSLLGGVAVAFTKSFTDRVRMLATESPEQAATMAADTFKAITAVMGVIPLAAVTGIMNFRPELEIPGDRFAPLPLNQVGPTFLLINY